MRVLIVSPYFPPLLSVGSLRAWSFATGFADRGHEVHVLTTAKREDQRGLEAHDGRISVHEVPVPGRPMLDRVRRSHGRSADEHAPGDAGGHGVLRSVKERTGVFSSVRMPDLTDAWVRPASKWALDQPRWDATITCAGPYTAHLVGLRMGGHRGRWITDFRDLWTANHHFGGLYPFTLRERALERRVLAQADVVTTVSEPLAEQLRGGDCRRVLVIYNGYFEHEPEPVPDDRAFRRDGCVRLVYTGSLYPKHQDAEALFRAIAALGEDAARVRVVVAGGAAGCWRELADRAGVGRVLDHRGLVSRPEALRLQRDADALLAIEFEGSGDGVLSGKIFEYLHAPGPIMVVGNRGCVGELVCETGRGVCATTQGEIECVLRGLLAGEAIGGPRDEEAIAAYARERQAEHLCLVSEQIAGAGSTLQLL